MNQTSLESIVANESAAHVKQDIFTPDGVMMVLTWVTFLGLLLILQKFAWNPILTALNKREEFIRDSLNQADQIKVQLADVQTSKAKIILEARQRAQEIIDESRKKSLQLTQEMEERAKKQADEIVHNAHSEIAGERERVRIALRKESATMAIDLASKLLKENLDRAKSNHLIEQYIKEL